MSVAAQGTKSFDEYSVFLRAMGTALSQMGEDDKEFYVYSAGPSKINSMALEFCNVSEDRQRVERLMKHRRENSHTTYLGQRNHYR
jgi:hypothetical protein